MREASQGDDLYIDVDKFLRDKGPGTKAFHFRHRRVGLQESCPQNNFRRVIAALVPNGEFCNHKINYLPEHTTAHPLEFIVGLLNSKLIDWYFRLGSTNAAVSHYQLYNLPVPNFTDSSTAEDARIGAQAVEAVVANNLDKALQVLDTKLMQPPFSLAIRDVIVTAVKRIIALETDRGNIARVARSALAPAAQPYQDLIDQLLFKMAGLTAVEARGLEARLEKML